MILSNVTLIVATVFVGLMAGLFFSYSCSVTPALGKLPDAQYISAMQSINRAIQNPLFFIVFFGVLISLPACMYLQYSRPPSVRFWLLLTATIIYFAGSFGVTALGNIPLNNVLDKFNPGTASSEEIHLQRLLFESKWNYLNIVRTVASLVSFIFAVIACGNSNE